MHIKKLKLTNYRGIENCTINFNSSMNVIVGANGRGKSTILDACALLLNRAIPGFQNNLTFKKETDITKDKHEANLELEFSAEIYNMIDSSLEPCTVTYAPSKIKNARYHLNFLNVRNTLVEDIIINEKQVPLPIIAYYRTERAVFDIPKRLRTKHYFKPINAYDDCLAGKADFRLFFEWFRNQDDIINEQYRKTNILVDTLKPIKEAISNFTGFHTLEYTRKGGNKLLLKKTLDSGKEVSLDIQLLSQGEKIYIALIGDIARKLMMLNPTSSDPFSGNGIVLIDEVELHLHPKWQREILQKLAKTFQNCQFIVSTHSPQVISSVSDAAIFNLDTISNEKATNAEMPLQSYENTYGKTSNQVLETVLNVKKRDSKIEEIISNIYNLIETNIEKAKIEIEMLEQIIGPDPEITRMNALVKRISILGK